MARVSKYCLYLENVSSMTRSADIRYEMERAGPVYEVVRDAKNRCALVEFKRSDDAAYAWKKMDGFRFDGREWKVEWANPSDFKYFDKEWTEGGLEKSSRSRSRSPPNTPHDEDRRLRSPSAAKNAGGSDDDRREY